MILKLIFKIGLSLNSTSLFGFFMRRVFFAILAILGQFQAIFQGFFIFMRMMSGLFANRAFHFYRVVLGHKTINT
jgi:hypothetical protein